MGLQRTPCDAKTRTSAIFSLFTFTVFNSCFKFYMNVNMNMNIQIINFGQFFSSVYVLVERQLNNLYTPLIVWLLDFVQ